jgi:hypothetical protein
MAKKASRNPTPALWEDIDHATPGTGTLRPLPASVQALFLPALVKSAAENVQIHLYSERREQARSVFLQWIEKLRSGLLRDLGETQVEQDFTTQLLAALGYSTVGQTLPGQPWSMQPKWGFPNVGIADVVLGRFEHISQGSGVTGQAKVVVELKGARADLDRKDPSTGRSPVQQAWDYLTASDTARWAIVSNFVEIRLYHRDKGRDHLHRVALESLEDPQAFAEFFAIFHADSLISDDTLSPNASELLRLTNERQEKVGEDLYRLYNEKRFELVQLLRHQNGLNDLDLAIQTAQKLLDRILFIAFAEDRKLLDNERTLEETFTMRVPMLSAWNNFQNLFRALDQGDRRSGITKFDGSLFTPDPILDDPRFTLDDAWPNLFKTIGGFDFRNEVSVEVLGRIFEWSIKDLEKLKEEGTDSFQAEIDQRRTSSRRKREGVFYTDRPIVRYLVSAALDPTWESKRAEFAARYGVPPDRAEPPPAGFTRALLGWLDGLTVCDPACGSGAFLIAAYDWFEERRMGLLDDLSFQDPDALECQGGREDWRAASARQILQHNLYGVDLAPESIEIARLSLWIRTARKDQTLTDLTHNILQGNSIVADRALDDRAFAWRESFPEVFERGGFDAVVGNPPYVRQERLGLIKPYLEQNYRAYHGMADLFVYFYERGLDLLKPGGRLAFVVTNKWLKSGYGEPLRRLYAEHAWVESVVDFGHAKPFFKDADVFPCFLVARKPTDGPKPKMARVCVIPREVVRLDELTPLINARGIEVEQERFSGEAWTLEPKAVTELLAKIRDRGVPLSEYVGSPPFMGIKTGLNEAFLIDTPTRESLIREDPGSADLIRPYLRGQDIERWHPEWAGLWMIALKSSGDHPWPWADRGEDAEACFAATYPSLHFHLKRFESALVKRQDQGRYWWELRSCAYWDEFNQPKIIYQEIQYHPAFSRDREGLLGNNKTFFIPFDDLFLLGILNSPLMWWHNWRFLPHMKDEALTPVGFLMESLPIVQPADAIRAEIEAVVHRLIEIVTDHQSTRQNLRDWLHVQYSIETFSNRLADPISLETDAFVAEVQKARGRRKTFTSAALRGLRDEYNRTIEPARKLASEALHLEGKLHDLVNAAYGLTPEEVRLIWDTAPPRMPIPRT